MKAAKLQNHMSKRHAAMSESGQLLLLSSVPPASIYYSLRARQGQQFKAE